MKPVEVVTEGAVTEDGRLIVEGTLELRPGRVEVIVRQMDDAVPGTLLEVLKPIWAELDAQGVQGRTLEEAVADVRALRDEWAARERRLEEVRRA